MALDGAAFSPKEFGLAIQTESNIGTKVTSGMTRVNVDSVEMPGFNLTQVLDARSGSSGRVADADDAFTSDKGTVKEISFSGIFDATVAPILIQNVCASAESSDITTIAAAFTPDELQTGASSAVQKTFSLCVIAPTTNDGSSDTTRNMVFPGCVLTSLTVTGDMGDESGRLKFSATAQSGYAASYNHAAPTVSAAYGSTYYSLATLSGAKTIAGSANAVIQSFSLNIENPASFVGQNDSSGNPDAIVRAIPEIVVTMDATVKYDDNTAGYMNTMKAGTTTLDTLLCDQSALSNGSTTFGVQGDNCVITSVAFNEANAMMVDVSTKFLASGGTAVFAMHT